MCKGIHHCMFFYYTCTLKLSVYSKLGLLQFKDRQNVSKMLIRLELGASLQDSLMILASWYSHAVWFPLTLFQKQCHHFCHATFMISYKRLYHPSQPFSQITRSWGKPAAMSLSMRGHTWQDVEASFFFWPHCVAQFPDQGLNPGPLQWSPNHWTTREVPIVAS